MFLFCLPVFYSRLTTCCKMARPLIRGIRALRWCWLAGKFIQKWSSLSPRLAKILVYYYHIVNVRQLKVRLFLLTGLHFLLTWRLQRFLYITGSGNTSLLALSCVLNSSQLSFKLNSLPFFTSSGSWTTESAKALLRSLDRSCPQLEIKRVPIAGSYPANLSSITNAPRRAYTLFRKKQSNNHQPL